MAISCSDVLPFSSTVQTAGCAPRANGGGFGYHFRRVDGTGRTCNVLSAVSPYRTVMCYLPYRRILTPLTFYFTAYA